MMQTNRRSKPPLTMQWGRGNKEAEDLRVQLDALSREHATCESRMRELVDQNTALVQLAVANQLLTNVGDHDGVLDAIEEIVVNMIGSEEMAVFELKPDGYIRLSRTRGVERSDPHFERALSVIQEAFRSGVAVVPGTPEVTAVVPLIVDNAIYGAVAIFRLLKQKPHLDATDHELFDLLRRQAAIALFFSTSFRSSRPTVRPPPKSAG